MPRVHLTIDLYVGKNKKTDVEVGYAGNGEKVFSVGDKKYTKEQIAQQIHELIKMIYK